MGMRTNAHVLNRSHHDTYLERER
ncbi:unnamed protein product [Spirodela intermedia]|uniref:Uncharacterized protein n=2 Tax=Spirodela intermedia TaxID=51605 RepID=A0A7I8KI82_SPIIN|nr:unnamed protein product [Spirodela intermedia]CAA6661029.1 unnamed protein product [Spirodela intermedia]CAA7397391.1 unnamed protein product [Spirodela intermedia]